jgi:hypothetical protein
MKLCYFLSNLSLIYYFKFLKMQITQMPPRLLYTFQEGKFCLIMLSVVIFALNLNIALIKEFVKFFRIKIIGVLSTFFYLFFFVLFFFFEIILLYFFLVVIFIYI